MMRPRNIPEFCCARQAMRIAEQRTASQLAAKERRLQQLQRAVTDLQERLVTALERNALACACMTGGLPASLCV